MSAELRDQLQRSVTLERRHDAAQERTLSLMASLQSAGERLLMVAGQLSQLYDDKRQPDAHHVKEARRWLKSASDGLDTYEAGRGTS